jgi:tryptophan-rich hypothetical protein
MNRLNPDKLLMSKWTATQPRQRERHFLVTRLIRNEEETVVGCELEAVINKNNYEIDWRVLKDSNRWVMGWK